MEPPEDQALDRLLGQVKLPQAPYGFEHRVMARLREERNQTGWTKIRAWWRQQGFGMQGGLATACAMLVLMGGVGVLWQYQHKQKTDQLVSALDAFEQYQQDQEKWPELDLYTSQ